MNRCFDRCIDSSIYNGVGPSSIMFYQLSRKYSRRFPLIIHLEGIFTMTGARVDDMDRVDGLHVWVKLYGAASFWKVN